jgi:hypothetical protein
MIELVYVSKASKRFSTTEMEDMLEIFRKNNQASNITGLLLYDGFGTFIQSLEGEPAPIHAIYHKISADQRHSRINLLSEKDITERTFPDWRMGFRNLHLSPQLKSEGFSNFLEQPDRADYLAQQPSVAIELLSHFKSNIKPNLDKD